MARTRRYQRKSRAPLYRALGWAAFAGVLLTLGFYREPLIQRFEYQTRVKQVRIEGRFDGMEPKAFEAAVRPLISGSFYLLDLVELERLASEVSWVGRVRVSRVWPDTLVFSIEELEPVAQWGDHRLVSASGEVFDRPHSSYDFSKMVRLEGPRGRESELLQMQSQLDARLAREGLSVRRLSLSSRLAWTAVLSDGLEISFGSQPPLAATERLFSLLPALRSQSRSPLRTVDLRYPRGFAVSFHPAAPAVYETISAADRKG